MRSTPNGRTPLRIGIDARLASGHSGGVEQVVIGLASALSRLTDGDEEYLFLAHPDHDEWIRPYLDGPCRLLHSRLEYPGQGGVIPVLRRAARERMPFAGDVRRFVPRSDGTIEGAGVEVMHFTIQEAFLTSVPSVYVPHDLQHLHLPELLPAKEGRRREVVYRTHCERAALVVAMTSWGRRNLIEHYGLAPEKVAVVPWGSVLSEYPQPSPEDLDALRARLSLPEGFLLYPAQTWPHKNHLRLLDAVAALAARGGPRVSVVCPGRRNHFFGEIEARLRESGLEARVLFPGFVDEGELRGLYSLARGLVFPSLFEGWGMPVSEAFSAGLPVASSNAASLPDLVGDAGLLFDPESVDEIATAMERLWREPALREELRGRGLRRAEGLSFDRTALLFRAHYRRIAGRTLAEQDRILLASPPPA
ncbi:MAG: glycosyltransferase family 4 protein [Solirubrobacterales bacterium]